MSSGAGTAIAETVSRRPHSLTHEPIGEACGCRREHPAGSTAGTRGSRVLVVDSFVDHTANDWREKTVGVSSTYRDVTLEPWYRGNYPETRSHRLYHGATPETRTAGMHSFFPCLPADAAPHGFSRPEIQLPGYVTQQLTQGKRIARDLEFAAITELWNEVARQVEAQGLCLGTHAELPTRRSVTGSSVENAATASRC